VVQLNTFWTAMAPTKEDVSRGLLFAASCVSKATARAKEFSEFLRYTDCQGWAGGDRIWYSTMMLPGITDRTKTRSGLICSDSARSRLNCEMKTLELIWLIFPGRLTCILTLVPSGSGGGVAKGVGNEVGLKVVGRSVGRRVGLEEGSAVGCLVCVITIGPGTGEVAGNGETEVATKEAVGAPVGALLVGLFVGGGVA